jgi:hypothetical protein
LTHLARPAGNAVKYPKLPPKGTDTVRFNE